jgi:hypothetical protein
LKDAGVGEPVEDGGAVLAPAHQAAGEENLQVLGDVGLAAAGELDEVADGVFPGAERLEEAEPHRLAQGAEALGDEVDGLGGEFRAGHTLQYTTNQLTSTYSVRSEG